MSDAFDTSRVAANLLPADPGWQLHFYEEVTSTMDVARELAEAGAPAPAVVIADAQTAGRGRLGRSWVSVPRANLYFTVLLRPSLRVLRQLAMLAPLAVAEGIEDSTGLVAEIKWPNDVQIAGLKVSGVLIDADVRGDTPAHVLVGIGINVNFDPTPFAELRGVATSLSAQAGAAASRELVLAATLNRIDELTKAADSGEQVQARWKARLNTLGRQVRVRIAGTVESGTAEDVTDQGSLVLRREDGTIAQIAAGEVTLRA